MTMFIVNEIGQNEKDCSAFIDFINIIFNLRKVKILTYLGGYTDA